MGMEKYIPSEYRGRGGASRGGSGGAAGTLRRFFIGSGGGPTIPLWVVGADSTGRGTGTTKLHGDVAEALKCIPVPEDFQQQQQQHNSDDTLSLRVVFFPELESTRLKCVAEVLHSRGLLWLPHISSPVESASAGAPTGALSSTPLSPPSFLALALLDFVGTVSLRVDAANSSMDLWELKRRALLRRRRLAHFYCSELLGMRNKFCGGGDGAVNANSPSSFLDETIFSRALADLDTLLCPVDISAESNPPLLPMELFVGVHHGSRVLEEEADFSVGSLPQGAVLHIFSLPSTSPTFSESGGDVECNLLEFLDTLPLSYEEEWVEYEKHRRESNREELPRLPNPALGYATLPPPKIIASFSRQQLKEVPNFSVRRLIEGYPWSVSWLEPVDLSGVDVSLSVKIGSDFEGNDTFHEKYDAWVYPSGAPHRGLEKRARVRIFEPNFELNFDEMEEQMQKDTTLLPFTRPPGPGFFFEYEVAKWE